MRKAPLIALLCPALLLFVFQLHAPLPPILRAGTALLLLGEAILSYYRPRLGFLVLVFFVPLLNNELARGQFAWFPPILVLLMSFLSGWLAGLVRRGEAPPDWGTPLGSLLPAYLWMGRLSALLAALRYVDWKPIQDGRLHVITINSLEETGVEALSAVFQSWAVFMAGPFLFQAVVALVQRRRHVRELLSVLAMGMLPGILFGVYQAKSDISLGNLPHFINLGRINATFSDPNALGVFLALVLPVLFGFALGVRRKPEKAGLFVLCALGLTTLAYSGSRTGFLGLALALLTAGYLTLRERNTRKSRWALIVTIFFGAVFFGGLFLSPPRKIASFGDQDAILPRRIAQVFVTVRDEGLLTMLNRERLRAWRESLTVIGEHPVAGIGLGTYWIEIPTFLGFNPGDPGYRDNASNKYLQVWAETGFLGLAFFGAILALIAVEALRGNRHHRAGGATPLAPSLRRYAAGSVLAMVFIYITGPHDAFPEIQIIFWLLIGLIHAKGSPPLSSISAVERDGGNKTPARRTWIWRGTAWLIAALIVLIQARSGWVCLSPSSPGREDRWMLASGFYPWQYAPNGERYRWTREESSVEMKLPDSASGLSTWLMIAHPDTARRPVEVRVYVNDVCEAVEVFSAPNERRDLALRVGAGESRRVVARFVVSRVYVPARHDPGNLDRRRLGVLVGDLVPLISPN